MLEFAAYACVSLVSLVIGFSLGACFISRILGPTINGMTNSIIKLTDLVESDSNGMTILEFEDAGDINDDDDGSGFMN